LQKATEEGLLSPLRDQMARLRVSLYADNAAVFINSVKEDVDMVMQIMHSFGEATGLCINVNKSTVAPISCSHINLDEVLQNFAGAQVQFSINYLGLPVSLGRLCMVHLQPILDRAAQRLSGWQGRLMNIGGRKELVKSVLSVLPTYLLTEIKPPRKFYSAMDKPRKRFLWAGNQDL
jgi:hypothetical protein